MTSHARSDSVINPEFLNLKVALDHAAAGIPVFPAALMLKPDGTWGKKPHISNWELNATTDEKKIRWWWSKEKWPQAAVGITLAMCDLVALDGDRHGGPDGVSALAGLISKNEPLPRHPISNTAGNGEHHVFKQPVDLKLGNRSGSLPKGIDVRGYGGWIVAPGTIRPDNKYWQTATDAPTLIEAFVSKTVPEIPRWVVDLIAREPAGEEADDAAVRQSMTEYSAAFATKSLDRYATELAEMGPESGRNNRLNSIAYTLGRMGGAGWISEAEVETALRDACDRNGLLKDDGDRHFDASFRSGWNAGFNKPRDPLIEAPYNSEIFLALEYVERYGEDLRYVDKWKNWLWWDGVRWAEDEKKMSFRLAQEICRDVSLKLETGGSRLANAKTRAAVVSLAQEHEKIIMTTKEWDTNEWLLNTPKGVVDLKDGVLYIHDRNDYITKVTAVGPDPHCRTPIWNQFLQRVTANNEELVKYLQRMTGYMLTGSVRDHALFFLYGTGSNGKSVFISTITSIMTEYHRVVPMDSLMTMYNTQHSTDIAGLVGARIASATEVTEGRSWDEAKIKQLTGGDMITARKMRQDFFDFIPQFKLIIAGNHKPELKTINEAICRRLHLVPFTVTIPEGERDKGLTVKLKEEWPGILQWMVEGCLEWQEGGLAPPAVVIEATEEYIQSQDIIGEFLEEFFEVGAGATVRSSDAFAAWKMFQEAHMGKVGHQSAFNEKLRERGFYKGDRTSQGYVFRGLQLREDKIENVQFKATMLGRF